MPSVKSAVCNSSSLFPLNTDQTFKQPVPLSSSLKIAAVGHDSLKTFVQTSPLQRGPIDQTFSSSKSIVKVTVIGVAMLLGTTATYYSFRYFGNNDLDNGLTLLNDGRVGSDIHHHEETSKTGGQASFLLVDQTVTPGAFDAVWNRGTGLAEYISLGFLGCEGLAKWSWSKLPDLRNIPDPFPNFPPLVSAQDNSRGYYGAEVRTIRDFKYGRFIVSMKPAPASGVVSSFFTFHTHPNLEANWNEIDIEFLGGKSRAIQFNVFTPRDKNSKSVDYAKLYPLNFTPSDSFHEYRFDWRHKSVVWYVDGKECHKIDVELNKPQKLMLNLWNSASPEWAGPMHTLSLQEKAVTYRTSYQWIKVFPYDENTMRFEDNFSFFEDFNDPLSLEQRWTKASHTFTDNMCKFNPGNAKRITSGNTSLLELSLSKNDLMLEQLTRKLHQAIVDGKDASVTTRLLKQGADPNWKDSYTGSTATHLAAWKNNKELIKTLLRFGANPSIVKNNNEAAYDVAKAMGHKEIVEILNKALSTHNKNPAKHHEL